MRALLAATTLVVSASVLSVAAVTGVPQQPRAGAPKASTAQVQFPKDFDPATSKGVTDVTPILKERKLSEGKHVIDSKGGLQLSVILKTGRLIQWQVTDAQGNPVPSKSYKRKTTCWECGVDAKGDRHCWKVPCPVIVGPWTTTKVIR